jgi:hypothetical protein
MDTSTTVRHEIRIIRDSATAKSHEPKKPVMHFQSACWACRACVVQAAGKCLIGQERVYDDASPDIFTRTETSIERIFSDSTRTLPWKTYYSQEQTQPTILQARRARGHSLPANTTRPIGIGISTQAMQAQ